MTMTGADSPRPGTTAAAFALLVLVLAELGTGFAAAAAAGLSPSDLVDGFVVTNAAIGLSCGVAGVLLAWQRPRNPVGWLLLGAGVCQAGTAAFGPLTDLGVRAGWAEPAVRTLATVSAYAWPWSIATFLPLALLLFPDGLLAGRLWRAGVALALVNGPVFALELGAQPDPDGAPPSWLVLPDYADLSWLWTAVEISNLVVFLLAAAGLVVRYRRGDEQRRRQLLWLVLALTVMVAVIAPWALLELGPVLQLLVIALVPAAMTIAVLRHQLLDIRLVLSRAVAYAGLTALVVLAYLGLVALTGSLLEPGSPVGAPVLATLLIAIAFNPVRVRLQALAERALYGHRADPTRVLAQVGERLRGAPGAGAESNGTGGSDDVLGAVCAALRLPFAAIHRDGVEQSAHGSPPETLERVPLVYRGEPVGDLVVGVRRGQAALGRADRAALAVLAAPLAVAVHATTLSAAVQRSREQIVAAREEERRRLRRDLHDGLGPALTGIAFQADAAGNLLTVDPARAADLLGALRAAATDAIADVRRLVYGLRPPALDELGLVAALRRYADQLGDGAPTVTVHVDADLPPLPAAVEVAAYRIAVEAVTNAVRHSGGGHVDLTIGLDGTAGGLDLEIADDGRPAGQAAWAAGVGLTSMRERAAELGGTVSAGPAGRGGRVAARLPL